MSIEKNYTPLKMGGFSGRGKESEPLPARVDYKEPEKVSVEKSLVPEHQETEPTIESVEVVPELPKIDDKLIEQGVEVVNDHTLFVNNRTINLPLSLDELDKGLAKPLNSGWRWLAELYKYIFARFHIVIKKVNNKLKLVEQD